MWLPVWVRTCKLGLHPNSRDMGRIATLMQIRSMLHSMSANAVGTTTRPKLLSAGPSPPSPHSSHMRHRQIHSPVLCASLKE